MGPGVPGSNLLVGILYGAADGEGKAAAVRPEVVARFTYPGDPGLSRTVISRAHRVSSGREVDASRGKGGNPKGDARTYPEGPRETRDSLFPGSLRSPRPRKRPAMRVYVPLTLSGLAEAYKTGELGDGPFVAYAVTPGLREWYLSDDIEELEYAALSRAALASLRLLAADPGAVRRRVVVAVDVPEGAAVADPDRGLDPSVLGEVRIGGAVSLAKAASVHVDADDAEADVAAAAEALEAADAGDDDAQFVVDGAEDHELLWFARQEIPNLVGLGD